MSIMLYTVEFYNFEELLYRNQFSEEFLKTTWIAYYFIWSSTTRFIKDPWNALFLESLSTVFAIVIWDRDLPRYQNKLHIEVIYKKLNTPDRYSIFFINYCDNFLYIGWSIVKYNQFLLLFDLNCKIGSFLN